MARMLDTFYIPQIYKKFAVCVDKADPEGFEPSPAGSVPLTDLESAVVAVQLRVYEGLIRLSPKPYLPSKGILECIK